MTAPAVVAVEGYVDVIAMVMAGFPGAVAPAARR
jgi:DNA primase